MKTTTFLFALIFCMALSLQTIAQQKLEGTIKSAIDNRPVVGAQVIAKGKSTGTITNLDGKFSIKLLPKEHILVIKTEGNKPQEIDVTGKEVVDVFLGDGIALETVVVGTNNSTYTKQQTTEETKVLVAPRLVDNNNSNSNANADTDAVLVCTSAAAAVYHDHKCKGLEACRAEVKTITLSEAKALNRRACRYCYGAPQK
ncbi:MAG: carboxypeptidase-like regulatory domain-containing protein [Chitinophagales bacterium]|jgi:hypothetical protein|nr:carboxypeptidase-like regulatory domain-containing protein [Chitinophagales bacterium]